MKRLLLVFISLFFLPVAVFAADLPSLGKPAPLQSFHEMGVTPTASASKTPKAANAAAMAKVESIMAAAKRDQSHPETTNNTNNNRALATQLSTLNQNNLLFQQETDQKINNLYGKDKAMAAHLQSLDHALLIMNKSLGQLHQQLDATMHRAPATHKLTSATQYALYAILAALVILILLMIPRRRRQATAEVAAAAVEPEQDTKSEFDFMSTREAIPAKLDLARAYIAMEDYQAATKVLKEVLNEGDATHRQTAQDLIKQISSTSSSS